MQNRITYYPDWSEQQDDYYEQDADGQLDEWDDYSAYEYVEGFPAAYPDMQVYIGIAVFLFVLFVLAKINPLTAGARSETVLSLPASQVQVSVSLPAAQPPADPPNPRTFTAPYTKYVVTQGLHGYSYGHAAVDLAAGQGKPVLSPINGQVTDVYVDRYGNPTIIIENEVYRVTMLHGKYDAQPGDIVSAGDAVGVESNLGYTTNMNGVRCNGRANCGFHTHLNVFDKEKGENVNPLGLFER
jgi:murein DD-endopeptidase MepM/ murein hydrolase activator NlpD